MRGWGIALLLAVCLVASASVVRASHKPIYKSSTDVLEPGTWEPHFVWLRSDYFNYMGQVWWQTYVVGPGLIDLLFLDLENFYAFRDGRPYQTIVPPLGPATDGAQYASDLSGDLPYFLVIRNAGSVTAHVTWTIFAEIDWRRWQGDPPGPTLNLTIERASGPLQNGSSWETTFDAPAVYVYHCNPHIDMTGIVEVVPGNATSTPVAVQIHDMGFHPEVIRVPVGSTVVWTNHDGTNHSVNLGILPGGFVVIPAGGASLSAVFGFGALAAAPAVGLLLFLRRRARAVEGSSKKPARNWKERVDDE